jgi:hypothetical protein
MGMEYPAMENIHIAELQLLHILPFAFILLHCPFLHDPHSRGR